MMKILASSIVIIGTVTHLNTSGNEKVYKISNHEEFLIYTNVSLSRNDDKFFCKILIL